MASGTIKKTNMIEHGTITLPSTMAGGYKNYFNVVFQSNFSTPPNIFLTIRCSSYRNIALSAGAVTANGFTVYCYNVDTNRADNAVIDWLAIG